MDIIIGNNLLQTIYCLVLFQYGLYEIFLTLGIFDTVCTLFLNVSYDLDLPENKSFSQLEDGLTKRGIDFPANARKTQLIKLWKIYVMTMTGPDPVHIPEIDSCTQVNRHDTLADVNAIRVMSTSGPSQDSPDRQDVHKHGDLHATMSSMRQPGKDW